MKKWRLPVFYASLKLSAENTFSANFSPRKLHLEYLRHRLSFEEIKLRHIERVYIFLWNSRRDIIRAVRMGHFFYRNDWTTSFENVQLFSARKITYMNNDCYNCHIHKRSVWKVYGCRHLRKAVIKYIFIRILLYRSSCYKPSSQHESFAVHDWINFCVKINES